MHKILNQYFLSSLLNGGKAAAKKGVKTDGCIPISQIQITPHKPTLKAALVN
jgi:hypothetical protein